MKIMIFLGCWRSLLPANRILLSYIAHAILVGDEDALRAISIVMTDEDLRHMLVEYRGKVSAWYTAVELLDRCGAYANDETAKLLEDTYNILKDMDNAVLRKKSNPLD